MIEILIVVLVGLSCRVSLSTFHSTRIMSNRAGGNSRAAKYDHLIKLLLIGDSGKIVVSLAPVPYES